MAERNLAHCTPLKSAYQFYRLDLQARRVAQTTLDFYRWRLLPFVRWCESRQVVNLHELTPTHIRQYLVDLQERGLGDYSQLAAARAIRAFLNYCARDELLDRSPFAKVRMPEVDDRTLPAFGREEIQRLLRVADDERTKTIVMVLLDTGLRAFELLALNGADVDLETGAIVVRKGKGRKERTVYLGARGCKQLRRYLMRRGGPAPDGPLFLSKNEDGSRLGRSGLFRMIRQLGKEAGVKPCTPHRFRRTFALTFLRNGGNIYALQRLMGHADINVLKRYLALTEIDLREAHARFGVVDNL